jgi:hypothetical protein
MNFTRGDIAVGVTCIFTTGVLVGMVLKPEPRFAACIEIPKQSQRLPQTKAEKAAFIKYYRKDL